MFRIVAFTFSVLSFSFLTKSSVQEEDLFGAQSISSNDFFLGNTDSISSLPWANYAEPAASYFDNSTPDIFPDLVEAAASSIWSTFSIADSDLDELQSSCSGSTTTTITTGKLRARDDSICGNGDAPSEPLKLQPNVFDTLLLPGSASPSQGEENAIPVEGVLVDDSFKKCNEEPYRVNLCCNGRPTSFFSGPKIWEKFELCSLCRFSCSFVFLIKLLSITFSLTLVLHVSHKVQNH